MPVIKTDMSKGFLMAMMMAEKKDFMTVMKLAIKMATQTATTAVKRMDFKKELIFLVLTHFQKDIKLDTNKLL